jgi:hypothetical protein
MFEKIISFRNYLLTEDNKVLKQTASDIADRLSSMLDLTSKGILEIESDCEDLFSLIQTMVHGNWLKQQQLYLVPLQTVAYNIKLIIDGDKEAQSQDIAAIIKGCLDLINNQILNKIQGPVNNLGTEDKAVDSENLGSDQADKSKVGGTNFDNQSTAPTTGIMSSEPPLGEPTWDSRPNS